MKNKKSLNIRRIPYAEDESSHVVETKTTLSFDPQKDYVFVKHGVIFGIISFIWHLLTVPILWFFVGKLYYGIKVTGKKNLKAVKKSGAVICFNHVFHLDTAMICPMGIFPRFLPYYIASPIGFKIPVVRKMLKYYKAVPVPTSTSAMGKMYSQVTEMLKRGGKIIIAPEGSEWPYYHKIRNFKKGAFTIASKAAVPVVPIVYSFRKQKGIWFWKKRPTISMKICEAIKPHKDENTPKTVEELKQEVKQTIEKNFYESLKKIEEIV